MRESTKKPGEYAVSCKKPDKVQHFIVGVTDDKQYMFEGSSFPSIPALISHYQRNQLVVTHTSNQILKTPIPKNSPRVGVGPSMRATSHAASAQNSLPLPAVAVGYFDVAPVHELADEPWFHGQVDKSSLSGILRYDGDYLVRESTRTAGELTLSVRGQYAYLRMFGASVYPTPCACACSMQNAGNSNASFWPRFFVSRRLAYHSTSFPGETW